MAIKSTIYKAEVQIADMDRHYYQTHTLTLARHPSETDERMMIRVLAFVRHASDSLMFGKGLSIDDEPDLWQMDLTGAIQLWLEVGNPDEKRILKACGRSEQVTVYTYSSNSAVWWSQVGSRIDRAKNLAVINIPSATSQALARLAQRNMRLQVSVQDEVMWMTGHDDTVQIEFTDWKSRVFAAHRS
ncbi:MAG: YaeQ family protein [Burkholderiaceae bacterium]